MGKLVPDYITTEDIKVGDWAHSSVLPSGTFVKPIEAHNLPRHIKTSDAFKYFKPLTQVYVYCSYGILCIERESIRRLE